jgi:hypothetical protein
MEQVVLSPVVVIVGLVSAVTTLLTAVVGILIWVGKRSLNRLDSVEATHVKTDTLKEFQRSSAEALEKMQVERREMHGQNTTLLAQLHTKVDGVGDRLTTHIGPFAVLVHRVEVAEGHIEKLRDFKHEHCEPMVRYVESLREDKPWERENRSG